MHALYFNTAASTITSNYNNVFFNPAANINFGFATANQATLSDWQTATSQDLNSVTINPLYVNLALGNLQPTAPGLNDLATPVGIITDILGMARSTTTPDIGAWEFNVGGCTAPPNPGNAISSTTVPVCPNEPVSLNLINNTFGTGQTYQWQYATTTAGPWTDIGPLQNSPGLNINPTTSLYYRCAFATNSTFIQS